MRSSLLTAAAILVGLLTLASRAVAHMMPAPQGTINIIDSAVFSAWSLPLSAFVGADDNHDGRLSQSELQHHSADLQAQIGRRVHFYNDCYSDSCHGARAGRLELVMPMVEPDERDSTSMAGSTHVLVLMKATFDAAPQSLRVETDLFGTAANERQFTIKATRGTDAEVVALTPARSAHAFFRSAWQVLANYVALGIEHIFGGTDHLLFLLTIIVAAAGWRYWFGVLTSVTIAHSISLSLAVLGLVRLSAAIVEPLLAASIVVMAVLNLRQRADVMLRRRMAIVFACGLLHGLGFASALADMGLRGAYRVANVVGFNVGIEVGQAALLCAVLAVGAFLRLVHSAWIARRAAPSMHMMLSGPKPLAMPRVVSWSAALLGLCWLLDRLGASAPLLAQTVMC